MVASGQSINTAGQTAHRGSRLRTMSKDSSVFIWARLWLWLQKSACGSGLVRHLYCQSHNWPSTRAHRGGYGVKYGVARHLRYFDGLPDPPRSGHTCLERAPAWLTQVRYRFTRVLGGKIQVNRVLPGSKPLFGLFVGAGLKGHCPS